MAYVYTPDPAARTLTLTFDDQIQSDAFFTAYEALDSVRCQDIHPALNVAFTLHYNTDPEYTTDKAIIDAILAGL